jgi:DNA-directed RNA polymerase specialized sigma24 family protein
MRLPPAGTDTRIDLQRCLLLLPADQRAVLLLVTLEDMAYEDVARVLGIPIGTVMSRLSRARARLRELMDGSSLRAAQSHDASKRRIRPAPPLICGV